MGLWAILAERSIAWMRYSILIRRGQIVGIEARRGGRPPEQSVAEKECGRSEVGCGQNRRPFRVGGGPFHHSLLHSPPLQSPLYAWLRLLASLRQLFSSEMEDAVVDLGTHSAGYTQAIALQTKNLCYHVSVPDKSKSRRCMGLMSRPSKERQILEDVSVLARPGELTAIMGPSGGGKTTLLELISSRISGNTTGEIHINGEPVTRSIMTKIAGYVKQKDILLASSTVREAIEFSAHLRLPTTVSDTERQERVDNVIGKLGLTKCAETKIGDDAHRGVSGGELKRTAIGVELVTQPNLLFLDEPTSGLDSSSAFTIVDMLQKLAHEDGTTVVCTLHQPRSNIFYLFDRLILLHAGRVLYQGPPADAIPFFALCGHPCPAYTNPPDFFMDVITDTEIPGGTSASTDSTPTDSPNSTTRPLITDGSPEPSSTSPTKKRKRSRKTKSKDAGDLSSDSSELEVFKDKTSAEPLTVDEMVARWRKSKKSKRVVEFNEELQPVDIKKAKTRKPGCFSQTVTLFGRSWKNNIRNPLILYAQLGQHVFLAVFIGLMYLRIGNKANSLMDRAAAVFFTLLNASWIPALTAAFVFPAERPLFNRERAGGFYKVLPYYLATTLSDAPLQILFVVLDSAISYWMLALNPSFEAFVIFTVVILLALIVTQSMALAMSALSPTADVANLVAGLVLMLFMAFGGFMLSTKNTPKYFYPFQYTSPFRYAYRALMRNDLMGVTLKCKPTLAPCPYGNYTIITGPPEYNMTGPLMEGALCTFPCLASTGEQGLKELGLADSSVLEDSMILLGMAVICRFIIWLILEFVTVGGS